jgi:hypothetical protein
MAAINGNNYAKNISVPKEQSNAGEVGGVVKCLFDQYTGTPTAADVLSIGKLPKGARILSVTGIGIGSSPSWAKVDAAGSSSTLAAGDVIASESLVKITIGTTPSANAGGFVQYVVD